MEIELKALLRLIAFSLLVGWIVNYVYASRRRRQRDKEFAIAHGCRPIKSTLVNQWPLGLDLLKRQYDAFNENRLFDVQAKFLAPYEATVATWLLGMQGIFTTDHKNVEFVNVTRFEDFGLGSRRDGCLPFLGEGIFCQDGPAWKHSREVLRRQFVRLNYNDLTTFENSVDAFVSTFANSKGIVDIQPACFQFTLSTTTALLFGDPIDDLGAAMTKEFTDNFDYASEKTALRIRLADLCFLYNPSTFKASCNVIRNFANRFVQKALTCQAEQGEREAFERYPFIIDMYKEARDPKVVCDQLINVLLAGRDTTACTMSWALFMLVRHPEKLNKLRNEIFTVTGGKTQFTRSHLIAMPYLKAVINEILRLYPQIPVNVRIAVRTTYLPRGGGPDGDDPILVKKGQGIGFSIYHMHRDKKVFGEDAADFRPERWLTGELDNVGSGFVPFHSGPRICLGKDFAFTEASFAIGRFVQAYPNLRLPDGVEAVPVGQEPQALTIVVSSAEGCKVRLD